MKYQFDVKLSEQDYLDFNIFHALRSHYGKKQLKSFRIMLTVVLVALCVIFWVGEGFSADTVISIVVITVVFLIFQIFLPKFLKWSVKTTIKGLKNNGKMGYSPESVLEFYDDYFIEIMPNKKIEQSYCEIEGASLVDMKMIYIYENNVAAFMLPVSCFKSKVELDEFIEFLKTKGIKVDKYC